ncbi:MAG: Glycosyl transferases group 1 [candidate division BRC1 bacterium ADurb.BinA364]|nr:MAG: Glycosyl transferases group 1 [candidate division BRC1 bacterium ADurb.BinA364]
MAAAFNRADVFLSLPETDLLSTTVLEGMACGCAPILADLPYYRSRVEHGKNGFYLAERTPDAIARAIEEAYSSPKRLAAMARENERLIALEDDAAKCGARMEALYEELCMRRRR